MSEPAIAELLPATRKRSETVKRVIEAANSVIGEKGFQRATLDEIAARAGLTKGAIYSNFASKEELFLKVVSRRRLTVPFQRRFDLPIRVNLRATAEAFRDNLHEARTHSAFLAEFILFALTHEDVRLRWAEAFETRFRDGAEPDFEAYLKAQGQPPVRIFMASLQSLALGLFIQHAISPDLVTDEVIVAAMEAMAGPPDGPRGA